MFNFKYQLEHLFSFGAALENPPEVIGPVPEGTGKLREHYDTIVKAGGRFYLSGGSSKARGLTDADLKGRPAEFGSPEVLLRLSLGHDRMFTY